MSICGGFAMSVIQSPVMTLAIGREQGGGGFRPQLYRHGFSPSRVRPEDIAAIVKLIMNQRSRRNHRTLTSENRRDNL
jgi:hypothetical protein